jgi:hypothetical protein
MHYIVPCSLIAFLLRGCTQHFKSRSMLSRIEGHGSAWRSSPRTGRQPSMTGGPAMATTIKVSIGGAEHAGGEWLLWRRRAGWDERSCGGGQCTLLPRCLLDKRLRSLFMEFDLALGVGVGWLGVWGVGGAFLLVWGRGRALGRAAEVRRRLLSSCTGTRVGDAEARRWGGWGKR